MLFVLRSEFGNASAVRFGYEQIARAVEGKALRIFNRRGENGSGSIGSKEDDAAVVGLVRCKKIARAAKSEAGPGSKGKAAGFPSGVYLTISPPKLVGPKTETKRLPEMSKARTRSSPPEAKVLFTPADVNLEILPMSPKLSVTNKLPMPSKVRAVGKLSPEAKVVMLPSGANSTIVPRMASTTKRLPSRSKAKPLSISKPEAKVLSVHRD